MKVILFVLLAIGTIVFSWIWYREARSRGTMDAPTWRDTLIGLFTLFLDTLGIGAFATTTAFFKLWKLVKDEEIPGTLNIGITLPAVAQAYIYMSVVEVESWTLGLMIAAATLGSWFGAGLVSRWPRVRIQIGMGITLLVTAGFVLMTQLKLIPAGGDLLGLHGPKLAIAVLANGFLGALMTIGIGFFAPCMMVVYLMGMSPRAAFPIMMGSCAFLGVVGSIRFVQQHRYRWKSAIGMTLGGMVGVFVAAYVVKELPLLWLRWVVFVVMIYTSFMMLRSARQSLQARKATTLAEPLDVRS